MKKIDQTGKAILWLIFLQTMVLFSAACNKETSLGSVNPHNSNPGDSTQPRKILFVGNSLTSFNNLPLLVREEARIKGHIISTTALLKGNYALEDHWNDGEVQALINNNKFDYVIIQQGPSSQADGRAMLMDYGRRLNDLCTANNSKLVFFMVWPAKINYHTFDGVIRNYTDAAAATNSILCPVGSIWKQYFDSTNDFSYLGADEFHPSLRGSQSAAAIIANTLF